MRFQRLVVGFLGAALLGAVPVTLTSSPATAGATTESRLVLDRQASSVYRYGQGVKVSGQIQATCSPGPWCFVDAPGDSVQLYRRVNGASTWKSLGTQYGDANGRFDFRTKSVGTAAYKVVYSGNEEYGVPAATSVRTIKGSRHPHSRGAKSGGRLYYRGNVDRAGATSRSPSEEELQVPAGGTATRPCAPAAPAPTARASTPPPGVAGTSARLCGPPRRSS